MTAVPNSKGETESNLEGRQAVQFNVHDVSYIATFIALLYFIVNGAFDVGLSLTSVSSSSTISSLLSLFTLIISTKISIVQLGSSVTTIGDNAIIGSFDGESGNGSMIGDCLPVVAAFIFGLYLMVQKPLLGVNR